jgi:hypothetical protein
MAIGLTARLRGILVLNIIDKSRVGGVKRNPPLYMDDGGLRYAAPTLRLWLEIG